MYRSCRLDYFRRDLRADSEVSDVSGGVFGSVDRNRAFTFGCNAFALVAADFVRRANFVSDSENSCPEPSRPFVVRLKRTKL